jgi:sterol desaturase/sphingolipid hydroxylase (fatty acid hydroxylase superfamily)
MSLKLLLRYAYAPLMLVGANGLAIHLVLRGAHSAWLLLLLLCAIAASFLVERIIPYEASWNVDHGDTLRDTAHAAINETLSVVSIAVLPAIAARASIGDLWPRSQPFVVQVLLSILVMDAGITLAHYASHRIAILWRLHAVHHSIERLYGFNGLMKHPLHQLIEMTSGVAPLVLLGLPQDVAIVLGLATAIQLLMQHSNADYRIGPLRYVLALNEGHRFHHLKWPEIGDVNFGLFTLIWDRLLGTHRFDPRQRFTSHDLGIEAEPQYPARYLDQLAAPFRR